MPSAAPIVSARCGAVSCSSHTCGSNGRGSAAASLPATGCHPAGGLLDQVGQACGVGVLAGQLAQGGEPVGALASEGDGELLALGQPVGQ